MTEEQSADEVRQRLGRASLLMATGTVVSRILGFAKAALLALTIGQVASVAADAFAIGNQLPNSLYTIIAGGIVGAVLVPQVVRAQAHADGGKAFINRVMTLGLTIFLVITVIATLCAPLLVWLYTSSGDRAGFDEAGIALTTAFAYWCLPQIFFYAMYSLLGEALNARHVFGPFMWAPAVNNVVAIIGLILFIVFFGDASVNSNVDVWGSDRIALLGGTTTLGIVAQAVVLVVFWKRAGLSFRPDFRGWGEIIRGKTGQTAGWIFGLTLVAQASGIVQTNVVSLATDAGPANAALTNSWLVFMLPYSVITVSIATAYFTRLSAHASAGDLAATRTDVSSALRGIGLLMVFSAVGLSILAMPFSRFFETRFDNMVAMTLIIIAYLIGLVPFSAAAVLQRVFYSMEDTRTPFIAEAVRAAFFVVGALLCTQLPLEWIGFGVSLVITGGAIIFFILMWVTLRRRIGSFDGRLVMVRHLQFSLAMIPAAAVGVGLLYVMGGLTEGGFAVASIGGALVSFLVIGSAMAVVYFGLLALFRNPELAPVVDAVAKRFTR